MKELETRQPAYAAVAPEALSDDTYAKNLVITSPAVVAHSEHAGPDGAWSFVAVMNKLARASNQNVDTYFRNWVDLWRKNHDDAVVISGFPDPDSSFSVSDTARRNDAAAEALTTAWTNCRSTANPMRLPGEACRIDLIAIVNRIDLTRFAEDRKTVQELGEGRLVYELRDPQNAILEFTLILEFALPEIPGVVDKGLSDWANEWLALGELENEEYLRKLKSLTDRFVTANTLLRIRSNDKLSTISRAWEMREFPRNRATGLLEMGNIAQTPKAYFKDSSIGQELLRRYVTQYQDQFISGRHLFTKTDADLGKKMLGLSARFDGPLTRRWMPAPPDGSDLGRAFAIMDTGTCDGCHKFNSTPDQHISRVRYAAWDSEAVLSPFLKGEIATPAAMPDCPLAGICTEKTWNERAWRTQFLNDFSLKFTENMFPPSRMPSMQYRAH
ncbi:MAG: hypothetical protein ACTS5I_06050 [Rhodanobacter sp.]